VGGDSQARQWAWEDRTASSLLCVERLNDALESH